MNAIHRRLQRLEEPLGVVNGTVREGVQLVVCRLDCEQALDLDNCVQILRDCGSLYVGPFIGLVDLTTIPNGLSPESTERFLRDNAATTCGPRLMTRG